VNFVVHERTTGVHPSGNTQPSVRSEQCGSTETCFWNYRDLLIGNAPRRS